MKAKDHLYQLIQTMSKSEKRYFKIFSNQHVIGEANNYITIFDAIESMATWDQDKLKASLDAAGIRGNLSAQKAYLFKLILKAMRAFHSESSVSGRLRETLQDAEFLTRKGLYAQASEVLEKASKEAEEQGNLLARIEILQLEGQSLMFQSQNRLVELAEANIVEREKVMRMLQQENDLAILYGRVFALQRKHGNLMREPQRSAALDILKELPDASATANYSASSLVRYHFLCMMREECNSKPEAALHEAQQIVRVWEAHTWMSGENPTGYRMAIANLLAALFKAGKLSEFPEVLHKLKSIPAANPDDEAEIFQNASFYELLYHFNQAELDEAIKLVPAIQRGLITFHSRISKSREISFRFNICLVYFFCESWSDALKWLNSIRNDDPSDHRLDVQQLARVFELILHHELSNFDILENKIRSARRFYKLYANSNKIESDIVEFFARLAKCTSSEESAAEMKSMNRKLEQLSGAPAGPGITECRLWLRSKLSGEKLRFELSQHRTGK